MAQPLEQKYMLCIAPGCGASRCQDPRHARLPVHHDGPKVHLKRAPRSPRRLTPAQVATIQREFTGARGQLTALARKFDVAYQTIHRIVYGKTHKKDIT